MLTYEELIAKCMSLDHDNGQSRNLSWMGSQMAYKDSPDSDELNGIIYSGGRWLVGLV